MRYRIRATVYFKSGNTETFFSESMKEKNAVISINSFKTIIKEAYLDEKPFYLQFVNDIINGSEIEAIRFDKTFVWFW